MWEKLAKFVCPIDGMNKVSSNIRFPYMPVHVQVGTSNKVEFDIEALVDTGFGGGVAIPKGVVDISHLPSIDSTWILADGTEILTPAYLGYVTIASQQPVLAAIIILGDESLLGRQVTNHFSVTFDHGQKINVRL